MYKKAITMLVCMCTLGALTNQLAAQPKKIKTIVVDAGHGGKDIGSHATYENSLGSYEKNVTLAISQKLVAELRKKLPDVKIVPTRTTDIFHSVKIKADIANEAKGDLFICIHADSGPLKSGKRQIGSKTVTRYNISYIKKGKKKIKVSTPYEVEIPIYETYKIPLTISGTAVYLFAPHKTDDKLDAIMHGDLATNAEDSAFNNFNFNSPEGRQIAQIYAKLYQEKSELIATFINEEVQLTGRRALGVKQRQEGIRVLSATQMPAILIETGFINNKDDEYYLNSEKGQQELAEAITKAVIKYRSKIEAPKSIANK